MEKRLGAAQTPVRSRSAPTYLRPITIAAARTGPAAWTGEALLLPGRPKAETVLERAGAHMETP